MKKVLIYLQEGSLAKTGGQRGYNYALKSQLDKMGVDFIEYLPGGKVTTQGVGKKIKNTWYGSILKNIKDLIKWSLVVYGPSKHSSVDLNSYDIVHFHTCYEMYMHRRELENYKGTVLLTSHTPQVSYKEIKGMLTPWAQKHMNWYYNRLIRLDRYAFSRADYILFPCEEAEEPYYNTWPEFKKIKANKKDRFKYIPTGTYQCVANVAPTEIRTKYNIPQDAFVVCYVGRHNEIKGYDSLRDMGEKFLVTHPNAYFLVAGEEYPLKGLDDPHWIEVGWTNDPHSIINAADVFVLPNKETYFDLILLEVLSLGKIVIASNTGGNKYFVGRMGKGFMVYDDVDQGIDCLNIISVMDEKQKKDIERSNHSFFEEHLSLKPFADSYITLYKNLMNKNE